VPLLRAIAPSWPFGRAALIPRREPPPSQLVVVVAFPARAYEGCESRHMILVPAGLVLALIVWAAPDLWLAHETDPSLRMGLRALGYLIVIVLAVILISEH
jgi:hypothetical protein